MARREEEFPPGMVCTPTHPPLHPRPLFHLLPGRAGGGGRGGGERVLCVPQSVCGRGEYASSVCLGCRKEKRQKECAASVGPSSSSLLEAQQRRRRRRRRRSFLPPPQERWGREGGKEREYLRRSVSLGRRLRAPAAGRFSSDRGRELKGLSSFSHPPHSSDRGTLGPATQWAGSRESAFGVHRTQIQESRC